MALVQDMAESVIGDILTFVRVVKGKTCKFLCFLSIVKLTESTSIGRNHDMERNGIQYFHNLLKIYSPKTATKISEL